MTSITPIDRMFIATAVKKRVDKAVKDMRSETDAMMLDSFEHGCDRMYSPLLGKEAGSYTVPTSKGEPDKSFTMISLSDDEAYLNWISDNRELVDKYAFEGYKSFAEWCIDYAGVVPDGINVTVETIPGTPKGTPGTPRLVVKDDVVFDRLQELGLIEEVDNLLLEGEVE